MSAVNNSVFLFIVTIFLLAGCSKSDDQRRFENRALSDPEGITEMNIDGNRVENGEYDPGDWETGPVYAGQIEVETPAWPNPVPLNSNLSINLDIIYPPGNLSGIEVFTFQFAEHRPTHIATVEQHELTGGLVTINLNPQTIAGTPGAGTGSSNMYRILLYDDGQRNLITYGDVRIE